MAKRTNGNRLAGTRKSPPLVTCWLCWFNFHSVETYFSFLIYPKTKWIS